MLAPNISTKVLDAALSTGADFAEIFIEDSYTTEFSLTDGKPSKAVVGRLFGAGIRVFFGKEVIYTTCNDMAEASLLRAAQTVAALGKGGRKKSAKSFVPTQFDSIHAYGTRPWEHDRAKKFSYLQAMDQAARAVDSAVTQVIPYIHEKSQKVLICNSEGVWVEDERNNLMVRVEVFVEENGVRESAVERIGTLHTSEYLDSVDFAGLAASAARKAKNLLKAEHAPAGEMPVIIDQGFGGVIFHEACGHGLETTSVAPGDSVFSGLLGKRVAESCVTAIDDGTLANTWGSLSFDDEGRATQKTTLIENGVLKSYMVDEMGGRKTGFKPTGSGRRQSYKFAPDSRMRNTYIAPGTDRLEDMIRDLDYGLYAKTMGGGSVSPGTGEYNFGVNEAYLVRNGKIERPVKGAVLIGRGLETLGRIVKVGDNLSLEAGICGSVSGHIPTTVGQPALLVSSILVGGRAK